MRHSSSPTRGVLLRRIRTLSIQVLLIGLFLVAWHVASGRLVARVWLSTPGDVAGELRYWFTSGYIYPHLLATLKELVVGLVLGGAAAIVLGIIVGSSRWVSQLMSPIFAAAYSVPHVAILPLFVLWFGLGLMPRVLLVAISVFFPIYTNVVVGIATVDAALTGAVSIMGASFVQRVRLVVLPSLVAFITAGLAMAVPLGLLAALLAEMLQGTEGLGWIVISATNRIDFKGAYAAGVVVCVIAAVFRVVALRVSLAVARRQPGDTGIGDYA